MTTTTRNDMPRVDIPLDVVVPDTPESLVAPQRRGPRTWLAAVLGLVVLAVLIAIATVRFGDDSSLDIPTAQEEAATLQAEKVDLLARAGDGTTVPTAAGEAAVLQAEKVQIQARANDSADIPSAAEEAAVLQAEKEHVVARGADGTDITTSAEDAATLQSEKTAILAD